MRILKTLATASIIVSIVSMAPQGATSQSKALDVGDKAPDFNLTATTGGKVSLSQFRGKKIVLLEFYGGDFSPV